MSKFENLVQLNHVYGDLMHMIIKECLSLLKIDIVG